MSVVDVMKGRRAPVEQAQAAAQVEAVERAQHALDELHTRHETELEAATAKLAAAQEKLDGRRRALIRDCAKDWRAHAERLRERAGAAGDDETVVGSVLQVTSFGPGTTGGVTTPQLRWARDVLLEDAKRVESVASGLEHQAREPTERHAPAGMIREAKTFTDGLSSEQLAAAVAALEWPDTRQRVELVE